MSLRRISLLLALALAPACATAPLIPGTTVEDSSTNRQILSVLEDYRHALEDKNAARLLTLASPQYYEDSGTPTASDDYGYDGLRQVLETRLASVRSIRYNIEYRHIELTGKRAHVDIRYDASYQMATAMGDRWEHKASDKRIELENDKGRWLIVAGM